MLVWKDSVQGPLLLKYYCLLALKQCLHLSQKTTLHNVMFIVSNSKYQ